MSWGAFTPLNRHQLHTATENELEINCLQWFSLPLCDRVKGAEIVWHPVVPVSWQVCHWRRLHTRFFFQFKPGANYPGKERMRRASNKNVEIRRWSLLCTC